MTGGWHPAWLRPPSRWRAITEATIGWDAEALQTLADLAEQRDPLPWPPAAPPDVAAAIAEDHASAAADDDRLTLEYADYQAELAELRRAAYAQERSDPERDPALSL